MFEYHVDIVAFAGDVPDRLAELARLFRPRIVFWCADPGHRAPAVEILAVDDALRTERQHELTFGFIRNNTDRVGSGYRAQLHGERAQTAARAPHQHVVTR